MSVHEYLKKYYLKIDARFPPSKWAKSLQEQNLGQTFFTTNNSHESLNAFLSKDLPPGDIAFSTALEHVNGKMVQLQLKEAGLMKVKEFRKRCSRALTMRRCTRFRQTKTLKRLTPKKPNESGYKDQKRSVRVSLLLLGKTHSKETKVNKEDFENWFLSYKGECDF